MLSLTKSARPWNELGTLRAADALPRVTGIPTMGVAALAAPSHVPTPASAATTRKPRRVFTLCIVTSPELGGGRVSNHHAAERTLRYVSERPKAGSVTDETANDFGQLTKEPWS